MKLATCLKRKSAASIAPSMSGRRFCQKSESGNHLGEVVQLREFWLQRDRVVFD